MRAIVLVGGQGTRLRPLTYSMPKPLLPVAGRPMISLTIEWLASYGIDEVVFSLGYRPDAFVEAFPDERWAGVRLHYAVEPEPLDTAGAIRFAAEHVGATAEQLVAVNGDVLTDLDLAALLEFHASHGGEGTIHLTPVENPSAFGVVPVSGDGRAIAFVEKPEPGTEPTNFINAGTYVLEPAALARIPHGERSSIERAIFPEMVADGELFAMQDSSYWIDTGTLTNYLKAQVDVLSGARTSVVVHDCEEVAPGVFVGPQASVRGAVVGPALIGAGALVDDDAVVESSVLGPGVKVGRGASLRNSVALEGVLVEQGARVERSILGGSSVVGASAYLCDTIVGFGQSVAPELALDGARIPE